MSDEASVILRPAREDDLPLLERFLFDPEAASHFQWFGWRDTDRFRRRFAESGLLGPDGGQLIVDASDGAASGGPFGFVSWHQLTTGPTSSCWSAGIALAPEARGRGIGTRAQLLLVRYLFAHTPVQRIQADTDAENIAEQRALEKAGFTREGVMRSLVFRDGRWRDSVLYAVLRDDPLPG
ncbi:GNAT family N-acetyltransferase [Streptomyces hyaluromycini]|uniref:GNAT family N-acetyltransferase n=1 Tax=Streptomyces hyaluromycini TaxID=1377993 RepID=UPI000B5C613D|nr:GNAT family protein [Streptomyces hyaluromycini]